LKLHGDQSLRLDLDDSAIRIADNQLTHEVPQKRKVPDNHQPVFVAVNEAASGRTSSSGPNPRSTVAPFAGIR